MVPVAQLLASDIVAGTNVTNQHKELSGSTYWKIWRGVLFIYSGFYSTIKSDWLKSLMLPLTQPHITVEESFRNTQPCFAVTTPCWKTVQTKNVLCLPCFTYTR